MTKAQQSHQRKRGRPPRDHRHGAAMTIVTVRLHPGEVEELDQRTRDGGFLTRCDVIREALRFPVHHPVKYERIAVPSQADLRPAVQLALIGNNLNQIARRLNEAMCLGSLHADEVQRTRDQLTAIQASLGLA